jgi:sulfide dehydrogenase cytochrome subunit
MKTKLTRSRQLVMACTLGLASIGLAHAEKLDAQRINNLSLAATCAACHGTNGVNAAGDMMHPINHYSANQIQELLMAYKNDQRQATIMHQLAKGYTDEQIAIIAEVLGKKD